MAPQNYQSIPQLAQELGLTRDAVYKKVKRGEIKAAKVGRNFAVRAVAGQYISIPELAKLLGISRIAVYKRVKAGRIKAHKVGRNHLIEAAYVNEYCKIEFKKHAARFPQEKIEQEEPVITKPASHLSIPQLAAQLGLTRDAVYKKVRRGALDAAKVGGKFGFAVKEGEYISIPEFARELNVSRIAVYKRVKKGEIKAIRIGRSYAIKREELGSFLLGKKEEGKR